MGEEGEICIAGPAVMLGYLDDPEANAETLRGTPTAAVAPHRGPRPHGRGRLLLLLVRLKRMIKSSGFNVYPAQVEAVLPSILRSPRRAWSACPTRSRSNAWSPGSCRASRRGRGRSCRMRSSPLPRAPDQVVVPARGGVRRPVAADQCGQGRLPLAGKKTCQRSPDAVGPDMDMSGVPPTAANASRRRSPPTACASSSRCAAGTSRRSSSPPRRAASASSTRATRRPRSSRPTPWRGSPARPASRRSPRDPASPTRSPRSRTRNSRNRRWCCSAARRRPRCRAGARCRTSTRSRSSRRT